MAMNQDCEARPLLAKYETERKENDTPIRERTSTLWTVFLNAVIYVSILNFPQAFNQADGVVDSIIIQSVLLLFILSSLIILTQTSDISHVATLQNCSFTSAGVWDKRITSLTIGLYCFGTCVTFLIIIGDQFDQALFSFVGPQFCSYWYLNRNFLMPIISVVLILPMCYTKKIDFLKFTSFLGVLAILQVIIIMLWEFASGDNNRVKIKTIFDLFLVIPMIWTVTAYPILFFCGREAIYNIIKDMWPCQDSSKRETIVRVVIASLWFFFSVVLAVSFPNLGAVIKILGSFGAIVIFVFPGICLLQTTLAEEDASRRMVNVLMAMVYIIVGAFILGVMIAQGSQGINFKFSDVQNHQLLCVKTR